MGVSELRSLPYIIANAVAVLIRRLSRRDESRRILVDTRLKERGVEARVLRLVSGNEMIEIYQAGTSAKQRHNCECTRPTTFVANSQDGWPESTNVPVQTEGSPR
jgi:hypothetical protein